MTGHQPGRTTVTQPVCVRRDAILATMVIPLCATVIISWVVDRVTLGRRGRARSALSSLSGPPPPSLTHGLTGRAMSADE
jgi:hypothetical protein